MPLCPDCGQRVRLAHEGPQAVTKDAKPKTQEELSKIRELKGDKDGSKEEAKEADTKPPTLRTV